MRIVPRRDGSGKGVVLSSPSGVIAGVWGMGFVAARFFTALSPNPFFAARTVPVPQGEGVRLYCATVGGFING